MTLPPFSAGNLPGRQAHALDQGAKPAPRPTGRPQLTGRDYESGAVRPDGPLRPEGSIRPLSPSLLGAPSDGRCAAMRPRAAGSAPVVTHFVTQPARERSLAWPKLTASGHTCGRPWPSPVRSQNRAPRGLPAADIATVCVEWLGPIDVDGPPASAPVSGISSRITGLEDP